MNKRGVGAIIGAIIILTVIFTSVATYFLTIQREGQKAIDAQKVRLERLEERSKEEMDIKLINNNTLHAYITNKGYLTTTLVYYILISLDSNKVIKYGNINITLLNGVSNDIDLEITPNTSYMLKVITERGSVFSASCYGGCNSENISNNPNDIILGSIAVSLDNFEYKDMDDGRDGEWKYVDALPFNKRIVLRVEVKNLGDPIKLTSRSAISTKALQGSNNNILYLIKGISNNRIDYLHDEREPYIILNKGESVFLYFGASNPNNSNPLDPPRMLYRNTNVEIDIILNGYKDEKAYSQIIPYKVINT